MHTDREVLVRTAGDFSCPESDNHRFDYLVDRVDGDSYTWLIALCCDCPGDEPFWLVLSQEMVERLNLGDGIREDEYWQARLREMILQAQLEAISPGDWTNAVVALAGQHELVQLRTALNVPEGQNLLDWVRHLDHDGRLRLAALYAGEFGIGQS